MYEDIGRSRGTDFFRIADQLTAEERAYWRTTRDFVDDEVLPVINDYWERAEFPRPLVEKLGKLGIVGDGIEGYGCPPMSPIACGLIHMELNRGDGSVGTFLGVQAGLAMQSIAMLGSEEQKERWLPAMAQLGQDRRLRPHRADPRVGLGRARNHCPPRRRHLDDQRCQEVDRQRHDRRRHRRLGPRWGGPSGERLPRRERHSGLSARKIEGKGSLRSVWQAEIELTDVQVDEKPAARREQSSRTLAACSRAPGTQSRGAPSGMPLPHTRSPPSTAASGRSSASRWSASRSCRTGW